MLDANMKNTFIETYLIIWDEYHGIQVIELQVIELLPNLELGAHG